jgi:hypothetical protein
MQNDRSELMRWVGEYEMPFRCALKNFLNTLIGRKMTEPESNLQDSAGFQEHEKHAKRETAWTPGPWHWQWFAGSQELNGVESGWIIRNGTEPTVSTEANAELIALAPEMAEAILADAECRTCNFENESCANEGICRCLEPGWKALEAVASKLRSIGENNA